MYTKRHWSLHFTLQEHIAISPNKKVISFKTNVSVARKYKKQAAQIYMPQKTCFFSVQNPLQMTWLPLRSVCKSFLFFPPVFYNISWRFGEIVSHSREGLQEWMGFLKQKWLSTSSGFHILRWRVYWEEERSLEFLKPRKHGFPYCLLVGAVVPGSRIFFLFLDRFST